ncbi:hypothetical protein BDY17DRAFT_111376 [Neohortaea acidophila]|uniref:Uncharacterized protein n=1 Tax=Neohortaea acidophila TaxID=245834 RepID=A0A6A6Q272_9PEZI|nr:uncharacterized protein BDY17DRAFT_111376 [Neohortaea acidophila]KAF2485773.1 hypothetical protein BDY17DRAFT_111376 [Neohortaea acidophila]
MKSHSQANNIKRCCEQYQASRSQHTKDSPTVHHSSKRQYILIHTRTSPIISFHLLILEHTEAHLPPLTQTNQNFPNMFYSKLILTGLLAMALGTAAMPEDLPLTTFKGGEPGRVSERKGHKEHKHHEMKEHKHHADRPDFEEPNPYDEYGEFDDEYDGEEGEGAGMFVKRDPHFDWKAVGLPRPHRHHHHHHRFDRHGIFRTSTFNYHPPPPPPATKHHYPATQTVATIYL